MNATLKRDDLIPFGLSGRRVTPVGLGGEGVLRTHGRTAEAQAVILTAQKAGITYYDSGRVYADSERYLGSIYRQDPAIRKNMFQASKSASRDYRGAMADLESTLKRLNTDYLDLWQIHDVRTEAELERISAPDGALNAFEEAKGSGRVKMIGVTGHENPIILTRAVNRWPVDAVMMPVNPVEAVIGGFLNHTMPAAREKGIAVIAMKVLGGGYYVAPEQGVTATTLIRFALGYDISVAIVGCSSPDEVRTLVSAGTAPSPLASTERDELIRKFTPNARKLAFYRGGDG